MKILGSTAVILRFTVPTDGKAYREWLDKRRAERDSEEYKEWAEARKRELTDIYEALFADR